MFFLCVVFVVTGRRRGGGGLRFRPPPTPKKDGGFERGVPLSLSLLPPEPPPPRARDITRPLGREAAKGNDISPVRRARSFYFVC